MAAEAVDWSQYFQGIKTQCPWSLAAYNRGRIDIVRGVNPKPLDTFEARIYILKNITPRKLKKIANRLDQIDIENEWLWSHPRYKKYSTPVPVLIQQNRQKLNQIRSNLNSLDNKL